MEPSQSATDEKATAWGKISEWYEREIDPQSSVTGRAAVPYSDQEVAVMLSQKKQTSHILHLLLSIITGGLWLIVWLLVASSNSSHNKRIEKRILKGKRDW